MKLTRRDYLVLASALLTSVVHLPFSDGISGRVFSLTDALLGAAAGALFLYGTRWFYLKVRGVEGLGLGDVKLIAMIGAFVGLRLTVMTLLIASVVGAMAGLSATLLVWIKRLVRRLRRNHESLAMANRKAMASAQIMMQIYPMPFGVFLGGAAMLVVLLRNSF